MAEGAPLGVDEKPASSSGAKGYKVHYIRLGEPSDVLHYCQTLINRMRRKDLELEPEYLGKIIYLLNTWLSAYKSSLEAVEVKQLREEIADMRRQMEARDRGSIIRSENR
jgi:anaerobic ribonucleoside-triphosphate reductase